MAIGIATAVGLGVQLWEAFKGKPEVREGRDQATDVIVQAATKGLVRSKTAQFATGGLIAKAGAVIVGVQLLPGDWQWLVWPGLASVAAEWGVQLWLRVKTREPVV